MSANTADLTEAFSDRSQVAPLASDLVLFNSAQRGRWGVSEHLRALALAKCQAILEDDTDRKRHLGAIKAVILADSLNVRREATASAESIAALTQSTAALRAALTDPALRQHLARLTSTPSQQSSTEQLTITEHPSSS